MQRETATNSTVAQLWEFKQMSSDEPMSSAQLTLVNAVGPQSDEYPLPKDKENWGLVLE